MKKTLIFILILSLFGLCACKKTPEKGSARSTIAAEGGIGGEIPITRGLVAKMVALAFKEKSEIETMERKIDFEDSNIDMWYDKYINCCTSLGYMSGTQGNTKFEPKEYLTIQQAQYLIDKLDKNNTIKISINEENRDKPISYELWNEIFFKVLKNKNLNIGFEDKKGVLLATADECSELKEFAVFDEGVFGCEGIDLEDYKDVKLSFKVKGGEIVSLTSAEDTTPILENVYMAESSDEYIKVFIGGVERIYFYNETVKKGEEGKICDIEIDGDFVREINFSKEKAEEEVLAAGDKFIELRKIGKKELSEGFKAYIKDGERIFVLDKNKIALGQGASEIYLDDTGKVCALIQNKNASIESVRVLLKTTGFKNIIHTGVTVRGMGDFKVFYGDEARSFKKGESFKVNQNENFDLFGCSRVFVKPDDENMPLEITSFARSGEGGKAPYYKGIIEIAKADGGFTVVNEVSFKDYILGVLSSKGANDLEGEKSKLWSMLIKNNAYNAYFTSNYNTYGANFTDYESWGIYNDKGINSECASAVEETFEKYVSYKGDIVKLNYFLSSSGSTANAGDVWPDTKVFEYPHSNYPYMKHKLTVSESFDSLSDEETAAEFFKEKPDGYEKESVWYRWSANISTSILSSNISQALKQGLKAPFYTLEGETVGAIKDLEVLKRGEGGNVMQIKIVGESGSLIVSGEQNIKLIFKNAVVYCGDKKTNEQNIPSTFFSFDKLYEASNKITEVKLYGGGYGHGTGLSVYGAYEMFKQGKSFDEALRFFYTDIEIE